MQALNPDLYDTLRALFDDVRVASEGEERWVVYRPDPRFGGDRLCAEVMTRGEQYAINCPFCTDLRNRFYVSYQYGMFDETLRSWNENLIYCFNEGCHEKSENLHTFMLTFYVNGFWARKGNPGLPRSTQAEPLEQAIEITLPRNLVPVNQLNVIHPAAVYLRGRGFDLDELAKRWDVAFCDYDGYSTPTIFNRIVIPVYQPRIESLVPPDVRRADEILVGWQARVIGANPDLGQKYLFCRGFQKSKSLYGLGNALRGSGPVVICEGVTDVWRLEDNAVALFGKSMSFRQAELLTTLFTGRPLVVLLDRDARQEALDIQRRLLLPRLTNQDFSPVVMADLPQGVKDPADCSKEQIRECVQAALDHAAKFGNRPRECE